MSDPYRDGEGPAETSKLGSLEVRALARYVAVSCVFAAFFVIYNKHPYYTRDQFQPWRPVFRALCIGWFVAGFFYVRAVLVSFNTRRYWMTDAGLLYMLIVRGWVRKLRYGSENGLPWYIIAGVTGLGAAAGATARGWLGAVIGAVVGLSLIMWSARRTKRFPGNVGTRHIFKNRRIRTVMLSVCVKAFFTPLMVTFLSGHAHSIANAWLDKRGLPRVLFPPGTGIIEWLTIMKSRGLQLLPSLENLAHLVNVPSWDIGDVRWGLNLAYDFVFFIDCSFATFGYMAESRFLGNKTRSVEPTGFGWLVAISCYPPFNSVLGTYLPLNNGPAHFTDERIHLALKALTVLLFTIYSAATVAFGFKFSNLTNRGIVTGGPYRFIRHPAYATKCAAWWLEHIPTLTIESALFLCGTCTVYALRAWTEERHLSMDKEYVAYKAKVKWKVFPGIW